MEQFLDLSLLAAYAEQAEEWVVTNLLVLSTLAQLVNIAAAFACAFFLAPRLSGWASKLSKRRTLEKGAKQVARTVAPLALPLIWLLVQWFSVLIAAQAGWPHHLVVIAVSLLTAWVIIRFASSFVRDPVWSKFIAIIAWTFAALNILGLLDDTIDLLDSMALQVGGLRLSALIVIKGLLSLAVLLWAATVVSQLLERRINASPNLTPSIQVLCTKLLKIVLITIAILLALNGVGIDLTAFAVFGGAIGVGIGFGLQKVVSNLISGVILLLDKSVKPGDVISVGDTFGWINSLGARYASVVTRDGTEWLIPNEDIITQQVVNWSYSNEAVRLKVPVRISYNADPHKAIALCFEAAAEVERILEEPKTNVLCKGFGDNSVDIELRVWIRDPQMGVSNVISDVLLRVWDKFHEDGIEIPFPQRDLHWKSPDGLSVNVRMDHGEQAPDPTPT